MAARIINPLLYVFGVLILIAVICFVMFYESPIRTHTLNIEPIERNPRFDELLQKDVLSAAEFEELRRLSEEHRKRLEVEIEQARDKVLYGERN